MEAGYVIPDWSFREMPDPPSNVEQEVLEHYSVNHPAHLQCDFQEGTERRCARSASFYWFNDVEDKHLCAEHAGAVAKIVDRGCIAPIERRGHPRFFELIEEIANLHSRKNSNYATSQNPLSNFMECEAFGIDAFKGTLVRMSDKWSRIKQLASGTPDAVGESIIDTLRDLSVYSLIAIILYEQQNGGAK